MRVASLSIGVVQYQSSSLNTDDTRLAFAVRDAEAVHRYAVTAWPPQLTGSVHLLLRDHEATSVHLASALKEIADQGRYDALLVYLSGHGQLTGEVGSFCLADAKLNEASLSGARLDGYLSIISSRRTLLLIDCCHAEAIVSGMHYFATLGANEARLFCASSRAGERSWEDSVLERSVFSHVLLAALSDVSPLASAAGFVDVEAALLPTLRNQVPLLAAKQKSGVVQQPVTGGTAASPSLLPTVEAAGIGRVLTLSEILRANARRIVTTIVLSTVVALVLAELLLFHFAVAADGRILIHPGLAFTYPLVPLHLVGETDTGFRVGELDPKREAEIEALSKGGVWGVATQRNAWGMRTWIDVVRPLLRDDRPLRRILGYSDSNAGIIVRPPSGYEDVNFVARTSAQRPADFARRKRLLDSVAVVNVDCMALGSKLVVQDYDVASIPSAVSTIRSFVRYLVEQSPDPSALLWKFARFTATRATLRKYDTLAKLELETFVRELSLKWRQLPMSPAVAAQLKPYLASKNPDACSLLALALLALTGPSDLRAQAVSYFANPKEPAVALLQRLGQNGLGFSRALEFVHRLLIATAAGPGLSEEFVDTMSASFFGIGSINPDFETFAESQKLGEGTYQALLHQLNSDEDSYKQQSALRYLARGFRFLSAAARRDILGWTSNQLQSNRTFSDFIVSLGVIGASTSLSAEQARVLQDRLSPSARFDSASLEDFAGSQIESNADPAVVAIAMSSVHYEFPVDTLELVEDVLSRRQTIPYRRDAIKGIASRWAKSVISEDVAEFVLAKLKQQTGSSAKRRFSVEVVIAMLGIFDGDRRRDVLRHLADRWQVESEPELRFALGEILARAED